MNEKLNIPRECEMHTVSCVCDHCGKSLDRATKVWVWNEFFGCTRDHVQRAKVNDTALASAGAFKQAVERDIDLL